MTEIAQSSYLVHAESFGILFTNILNQLTDLNSNLAYYTVTTMKNFVSVIGGHQQVCNICVSNYPLCDHRKTLF